MSRGIAVVTTARLRLALIILAGFALGGAGGAADLPAARAKLLPAGQRHGRSGRPWSAGPSRSPTTPASASPTRISAAAPARLLRLHVLPGRVPIGLQVMSAAIDKLGPKARAVHADLDHDRPGARHAGAARSLREELPSAPRGPHRHAGRDRGGRQGLSRVRQEGAGPKSTAGYTIDHSSIIYVMGPDGAYRAHFTLRHQRAMAKAREAPGAASSAVGEPRPWTTPLTRIGAALEQECQNPCMPTRFETAPDQQVASGARAGLGTKTGGHSRALPLV